MNGVDPRAKVVRWALLAAFVCGCAHYRNEYSGPDGLRITANPLKLEETVDDTVDAHEGDATDWRFIELAKHGTITAQVHWDNPEARLQLALADNLGKELARGEPSGPRGRQVVLADADPGRYFVMVDAEGDSRRTPYSLKVSFQAVTPARCHNCTVGQSTCVGKDGYAVCEESKQGCNVWGLVLACPADQTCHNGACAVGCSDQCQLDERRCPTPRQVQVCKRTTNGCLRWDEPLACESNQVCDAGRCRKAAPTSRPQPQPQPAQPSKGGPTIRGEIISAYTDNGQRMLWIKIGDNNPVQAGMSGVVLNGNSNEPLANGDIRIVGTSGEHAQASTKLESLGTNRWVSIRLK